MECDEMAMMGSKNVLNRGSALYRYMKCVYVVCVCGECVWCVGSVCGVCVCVCVVCVWV